MFKVNDRVQLTKSRPHQHYKAGAIATVLRLYEDQPDVVGIVSDSDPDFGNAYPVQTADLVHVTNVPTVRRSVDEVFEDAILASQSRPRGSDVQPQTDAGSRVFGTGATRDLDANKLDFEGFLSPLVLKRYAEHMHAARKMPDGTMRSSDNWQLGIPLDVYMKSMWRHFFAVWESHRRGTDTPEADLAALLFNVSGYLHETLKAKQNG